LDMNPIDAEKRGIRNGENVFVFNQQGAAYVQVRLTTDIMPGIVCLLEGMWVELDEEGIDHAGAANMFTTSLGTRPGHACIMNGIGVEVRPVRQE